MKVKQFFNNKRASFLLAMVMCLALIPAGMFTVQAAAGVTVTISYSNGANAGYGFVPQTITVAEDTAEEYGYTDMDGAVSLLDAVVAVHNIVYGEDLGDYLGVSGSGFIEKLMGVEGYNKIMLVNGVLGMDAAPDTAIANGDVIELVELRDSWAADAYTWFELAGNRLNEITIEPNTPTALVLQGIPMIGWMNDIVTPIIDAELFLMAYEEEDGYATAYMDEDLELTTGDDGEFTLQFSAEGVYYLSAEGVDEFDVPIILPFLKITVQDSDAVALAQAKTDAKAVLDSLKNPADYRPAQQSELAAAIDAGKAAIAAAGDINGVNAALNNAKATINTIRTNAQLTAEENRPSTPFSAALDGVLTYIRAAVPNPTVGNAGGEWAVLALARGGKMTDAAKSAYLANLRTAIAAADSRDGGKVVLDKNLSNANARVVLALTAMGLDASYFEGFDFVAPLTDTEWVKSHGINALAYALIALDSKPYPAAQSVRDALKAEILARQSAADNGWSLTGKVFDPDVTAMALQALAGYQGDTAVKAATDKAVAALSDWFKTKAISAVTSESYAQILTALSALGIDADTDARFIKEGKSLLNLFLTFAQSGGGFAHTYIGTTDSIATEQAGYALVAYSRFKAGKNALFDMRDAAESSPPTGESGDVSFFVLLAFFSLAGVVMFVRRGTKQAG